MCHDDHLQPPPQNISLGVFMLLVVANHPTVVDVEIGCDIDKSKASHHDEHDWDEWEAREPVEGRLETHIDQDTWKHYDYPHEYECNEEKEKAEAEFDSAASHKV